MIRANKAGHGPHSSPAAHGVWPTYSLSTGFLPHGMSACTANMWLPCFVLSLHILPRLFLVPTSTLLLLPLYIFCVHGVTKFLWSLWKRICEQILSPKSPEPTFITLLGKLQSSTTGPGGIVVKCRDYQKRTTPYIIYTSTSASFLTYGNNVRWCDGDGDGQ